MVEVQKKYFIDNNLLCSFGESLFKFKLIHENLVLNFIIIGQWLNQKFKEVWNTKIHVMIP